MVSIQIVAGVFVGVLVLTLLVVAALGRYLSGGREERPDETEDAGEVEIDALAVPDTYDER